MNDKLKDYETVKERKKKWYDKYPEGSLVSELIHYENNHCIIKGCAYRNKEEQEKGCPTGVGYAEEFQGQGGFANKFSWMENCDESAIGRALDNAGFSGNNKCSREEIEKVAKHQKLEDTENLADKVKNEFKGHEITEEEMRSQLASLPIDVTNWFKQQKYGLEQVFRFCADFAFNSKQIKEEQQKIDVRNKEKVA